MLSKNKKSMTTQSVKLRQKLAACDGMAVQVERNSAGFFPNITSQLITVKKQHILNQIL
jgi:hypothetical protein